ncbi:hypothetical protein [Aneurinibacillus aneurinilyticus]|uniref:Uncharacterized protein n=1 Tax=Aneurinibacillus aneurinilyticus ATCC 12856 TaxID=649747 RepID=U1YFG2_ANEAE|nr:hypothetical protein [Aneurinibacillus aneurinilyticus]ERI10812.1 hypothetical protein HMPREF0083_01068 [Aneurinibacillus aneurinilyticus ATCC 12856]MED0705902.1 hypothetical protein [Aneurinibacillus aneurinilyticus]MED0722709.1 hypothetical protein [Aneurinibacillus aneurinilyticus]MED0731371.1 hypothetical protein [Aneurinibacillus aneurinilyticus]MED0740127.1 hypothetical protein [Aneurinibacillus aneurinilyticus]
MQDDVIFRLMGIAFDLKQKEMAMQKLFGEFSMFATESIDHLFWVIHDSLGLPADNWREIEEKYTQSHPNASHEDVYQYMSENPEAYCSDSIWDTFHEFCRDQITKEEFLQVAKETAAFFQKPVEERMAIMKASAQQDWPE